MFAEYSERELETFREKVRNALAEVGDNKEINEHITNVLMEATAHITNRVSSVMIDTNVLTRNGKSLDHFKKIKKLKPSEKTVFILYFLQLITKIYYDFGTTEINDEIIFSSGGITYHDANKKPILQRFLSKEQKSIINVCLFLNDQLLKQALPFSEDQLIKLFTWFQKPFQGKKVKHLPFELSFGRLPITSLAKQFEKQVEKNGLSEDLRTFLKQALQFKGFEPTEYFDASSKKKVQKVAQKLKDILYQEGGVENLDFTLSDKDDLIASKINQEIQALDKTFQKQVFSLFHLAMEADGASPKPKFIKSAKELLAKTDTDAFQKLICEWFEFLAKAKTTEVEHKTYEYHGEQKSYTRVRNTFLNKPNTTLFKGLVWLLAEINPTVATVNSLARFTAKCFKKVPQKGPQSVGLGNTCIYALGKIKSLEAITHLSSLKLKIHHAGTRKLVDKLLKVAADERGLSPYELQDIAVPDFGLVDGKLSEAFGDYTLNLTIEKIGKTTLTWLNKDGKVQKSAPAIVKTDEVFKEEFKDLKQSAKEIQKAVTAQRDRIDRSYLNDRKWDYLDFFKYYIQHGLVGFIAQKLIWSFSDIVKDKRTSALYINGQWQDVNGEKVDWFDHKTEVTLWHPLFAKEEEVQAWRDRLDVLQIAQPFKQAYREIYVVTDAELQTNTYSNRMAAHLIKQVQFNFLTSLYGWQYSVLTANDDGRENSIAQIQLPVHKIKCEYWIDELQNLDANSETMNDVGVWHYVSTDQVRFLDEANEAMPLNQVPPIVFSEIMRHVDLFVGVCSVGNDPEWVDRGEMQTHQQYWRDFAFGELAEVAKIRKAALERLIPRLNIKDQVVVDGKYVLVKGKLREYKIHIGSSNILMEPNDQYLCIVSSKKKDSKVEKLFLPFEGDRGLSLVLSKMFLLASDDKIKDPTIVSQINRK